MFVLKLLGKNLFIGSTLTLLMMVLISAHYTQAYQDIDNFDSLSANFDDLLHEDEYQDSNRDKRSPCFFGNNGGGTAGTGNAGTGGGVEVPTDGDGDYEELTERRRNTGRRNSKKAKITKRRRKVHNLKNNEVQEVQEEILTRRKRQAPDFGGQQMGGQIPDLGGAGGAGGGDLKDKIKEIGSKMIDLGASVHEKIKEKIGQLGKQSN